LAIYEVLEIVIDVKKMAKSVTIFSDKNLLFCNLWYLSNVVEHVSKKQKLWADNLALVVDRCVKVTT